MERRPPSFVITCLLLALAGCATPVAAPNAGADAGPTPPPASRVTVGQEVSAVAANKIEVTFPAGSATLTPEANKKLDVAVRLFRDVGPVAMFTTGYSDRSGDEFRNLILSARRAEVVKRSLVARGIPARRLLIQALGSSELTDTAQPDNGDNRRVVITWRLL